MDIVRRASSVSFLPIFRTSPRECFSRSANGFFSRSHEESQVSIHHGSTKILDRAMKNLSWPPILGGSRYEINKAYTPTSPTPIPQEVVINVIDTGIFLVCLIYWVWDFPGRLRCGIVTSHWYRKIPNCNRDLWTLRIIFPLKWPFVYRTSALFGRSFVVFFLYPRNYPSSRLDPVGVIIPQSWIVSCDFVHKVCVTIVM